MTMSIPWFTTNDGTSSSTTPLLQFRSENCRAASKSVYVRCQLKRGSFLGLLKTRLQIHIGRVPTEFLFGWQAPGAEYRDLAAQESVNRACEVKHLSVKGLNPGVGAARLDGSQNPGIVYRGSQTD